MFGNIFFLVIGLISLFLGINDKDLSFTVFGTITILSALSVFYYVTTGKAFSL